MLRLAFFAIAGARRTQSAYPRFLGHAHSSTVTVFTAGYNDATDKAIAAIPEVRESRTFVDFSLVPLVDGQPDFAQSFETNGTFNGRYFDQDKFTPTQGRLADADRSDEAMINEFGAERLGYHVGQHFDLGVYDLDQITRPTFFAAPPPPVQIVPVTLVGIGVFPDEILQDDADGPRFSSLGVEPSLRIRPGRDCPGLRRCPSLSRPPCQIVPLGEVDIRLTSSTTRTRDRDPPCHSCSGVGAIAAVVVTVLWSALGPIDSQHARRQRLVGCSAR